MDSGIFSNVRRLKTRRTKIVATVGPASIDCIPALIRAGVNVFRLNFSHGSHEQHRQACERIRAAEVEARMLVSVLADLCGPKMRIGKLAGGRIEVANGSCVTITTRDVLGGPGLVPSQYRDLAREVRPGDRVLLDDGNVVLAVEEVAGTEVRCLTLDGGVLTDHKGMNLPGVTLSAPALTDADRADARFALALGVDIIALSFVRNAADVVELRALVAEAAPEGAAIIAKIEKREALENIDAILGAADGIMVARGDLGVELPPEAVPDAQEQLTALAREYRKPVIIATQMLESMIENQRPTRAEVADIAHAVKSGVDAVMLSAETATGRHPVEAVATMDAVARQTEAHLFAHGAFGTLRGNGRRAAPPLAVDDAMAESTALLSRDLLVRAIVVISRAGRSVAVTSSSRPAAPIIAATASRRVLSFASLLWGVIPVTAADSELDIELHGSLAKQLVRDLGLTEPGQTILVLRGFSTDPSENEPSVTVLRV
ncbi:MAG: pyruvate kinase [Candidatus Schekmanbacteria bacterium]|nr:pyruvate kinase [Candidatus Schekmanbacteria bacterium]